MRVLVCGGRDLDAADVWNWLERFGHQDAAEALGWPSLPRITTVIHGGARGADEGAAQWAESEGLRVLSFPADWKKHGKSAGPIRNARMLREGKPVVVLAFPGGRGTADMIRQAEAAGIPVRRIAPHEVSARPLTTAQQEA
ncbi:putative Rossmann-fold nucleotide-binding protein [Methylorubrum rhodinum]|uniref:Putative Rossmann-fold nucleotide-binding protein n=1 Tax=Methylorubrum rhodinum TaxID=29428 RepID=A0A840ZMR2_9HYPH|nr:SLOG family protein [Methylorubrum rhodinum]MBB5758886.1 putative Rossmann-fold nucleotide-binding protein [Methylorubrum rhodinum]